MKKLVVVTMMSLVIGNVNAAVECEKKDGRWYPKNELAISIASKLGVKTCSGKKFKAVVEQLGETSNVVAGGNSSKSVEDVVAELKK